MTGLVLLGMGVAVAQHQPVNVAPAETEERQIGPYDVNVLAGGPEMRRPIHPDERLSAATAAYTLQFWVSAEPSLPKTTLLAGLGEAVAENSRYIGLQNGQPFLRYGVGNVLKSDVKLSATGWHHLAAVCDGRAETLYLDGAVVARGELASAAVIPTLIMAPEVQVEELPDAEHFGGRFAHVLLLPRASSPDEIRQSAMTAPTAESLHFLENSLPWPVQTRGQAGNLEFQDPSLMPSSRSAISTHGVAISAPAGPSLVPAREGAWFLRNNWKLLPAPQVKEVGEQISTAGFADEAWMTATVPGTVLTTMINRGVYPEPEFGLNNLVIPESLNKHDYWYRLEFPSPVGLAGHRANLVFEGINYAGEVWLNGQRVGTTKGAFFRGDFDVTSLLRPAEMNALAVRISPPPHPGIPHEQSIAAGPGDNGGAMCLDGPTFVATEGWDWIPAIRDRNTGLWQDVTLQLTQALRLGDARIVTHMPLPDQSSADVSIDLPVRNLSGEPVFADLHLAFEGVSLQRTVLVSPGESSVHFDAHTDPALHLQHPHLWWPNGYGEPALYHLSLFVDVAGQESDRKELAFGVREVSYELTVFDSTGHLRRVEVRPDALTDPAELVDMRHEGIRQTAELWAPTLTLLGEHSPAVRPVNNEPDFTDLVIKVNGVRIAARGGNWGMDDARKRVSRERLEPFFRLHRDAHVNIIRNWVGQNTEEVFYQLADEYGLMVWNDFWASTEDYNVEPQDEALFLANARDVVRRFRNHPSIVVWCGRNEGVPQPLLNEGLIRVLREEDGTRYYSPGSNRIDLRDSGPYLYQDPVRYYSIDQGFSVELGISSLSTLESLKASMASPDQWPASDAWAYHDWHQAGNGDVHPLLQHMEEEFGAASNLEDFERKAQMFNYVDHRAIFEGFNQHLWSPNSGRLLWMTQPAWPSNSWQILSSDYDTQASFYGVQKALEPQHIQLDLSDFTVSAVNTTGNNMAAVRAQAAVYSLTNVLLLQQQVAMAIPANSKQDLFRLALAPLLAQGQVVFVELTLQDGNGRLISRNLYWLADKESRFRQLNSLPRSSLEVRSSVAMQSQKPGEMTLRVHLKNQGSTAALQTKLTLIDKRTGLRILPAYYSDNYVSLLPQESTDLEISYPTHAGVALRLRGWNTAETAIAVP